MLPPPFQNALVLTGPTASGKSALGLNLALRLGAEIISMDSMSLYRGMDIGTAKPTPDERRRVPHHLIDVLDPWQSASVAWWLNEARRAAADIEARGQRVLLVGGTPLYLKALIFGLFEAPAGEPAVRRQLEEQARDLGAPALHQRLALVDPASAAKLHPNDARRIVRALEVFQTTGRPISDWQTQWRAQVEPRTASPPPILWLDMPRAELYGRIDRRVETMFASGLVGEVEALAASPGGLGREARQALGYKEVLLHLEGRATLAETIAQVQQRTRNFAKRQITWFRHLPGCRSTTGELTWTHWQAKMHNESV